MKMHIFTQYDELITTKGVFILPRIFSVRKPKLGRILLVCDPTDVSILGKAKKERKGKRER
jgi:hypothetical protein